MVLCDAPPPDGYCRKIRTSSSVPTGIRDKRIIPSSILVEQQQKKVPDPQLVQNRELTAWIYCRAGSLGDGDNSLLSFPFRVCWICPWSQTGDQLGLSFPRELVEAVNRTAAPQEFCKGTKWALRGCETSATTSPHKPVRAGRAEHGAPVAALPCDGRRGQCTGHFATRLWQLSTTSVPSSGNKEEPGGSVGSEPPALLAPC